MDQEEANKFINMLVKNLQVLCHGHVNFRNSIQVIGHLYLNVDSDVNIDYIVNEKVCKSDTSSTVFVSKSYHSEPQKKLAKPSSERAQDHHRRPAHSESNIDNLSEQSVQISIGPRSDRQSFPHNYSDGQNVHQKVPSPGHAHRRPSAQAMEGPASKLPRLSQSPNMSPRNSQHSTPLKFDNRDSVVDNSSHRSDLSRLQQSNIAETSFHLQQTMNSNSQRMPSHLAHISEDSSIAKSSIKEEPVIEIDLSSIKDEPDDGQEDSMGDMSNDEFLASLQEKSAHIYPVGFHSNESQSQPFNLQNLSFPPITFQGGAGAGPSAPGSVGPDGQTNMPPLMDVCRLLMTKKRTFISNEQKRELCIFSDAHPDATSKQIVDFFHETFGQRLSFNTLSKVLKTKEKWLL